jgi:hypothetical protein
MANNDVVNANFLYTNFKFKKNIIFVVSGGRERS